MSASSRTLMLPTSKWLPLILISLGVVLVITAVVTAFVLKAQPESAFVAVPNQMAGLSMTSEATGRAALQEFAQLHGKSFPVTAGAKAVYGSGNQVILWTAGTATSSDARKLLEEMRDKIAQGNSPFRPSGVQTIANREVYTLDGMGQKHFYFQSGKYLIWLAADADAADQALQEALDFYP